MKENGNGRFTVKGIGRFVGSDRRGGAQGSLKRGGN